MATGDHESPRIDPSTQQQWRDIIKSFYPRTLTKTYCVPPLHFNRIPYDFAQVSGQVVLVLPPSESRVENGRPIYSSGAASSESEDRASVSAHFNPWHPEKIPKPGSKAPKVSPFHIQSDFAQQHVLANLKKLGEQRREAMFIISELDFKDYLNKPAFNKATGKLPKPSNINPKHRAKGYHRGDFDIIIISHHFGILVGEMKSVGKGEKHVDDDLVKKRVEEALTQVVKEGEVVGHLVSDVAPQVAIRRTLYLPYVSRSQLQRVMEANPSVAKQMLSSIGATDVAEAVGLCVCAEELSAPDEYWDITPSCLDQISRWWTRRMTKVDNQLTHLQYLDLVARFVGPATTVRVHCVVTPRVEVRTEGEAIAELGRRLSSLVLTPQQLDILNRNPSKVCICGPPGTGKTLMLVLQGLRWLREGLDVHVVSTDHWTITAAQMIHHQLQTTIKESGNAKHGNVYIHEFPLEMCHIFVNFGIPITSPNGGFDLVHDFACKMASYAKNDTLCVILDEGGYGYSQGEYIRKLRFITLLESKVTDFRVWVTSLFYTGNPPEHFMRSERVTTPLRSAPAVVREVTQAVEGFYDSHKYISNGIPAPGDGLEAVKLQHTGKGHECQCIIDCYTCGQNVAETFNELGVGSGKDSALQYSDVLIISAAVEPKPGTFFEGVISDDDGNIVLSTLGFLQALLAAGIPTGMIFPTKRAHKPDHSYNFQEYKRNTLNMVTRHFNRVIISNWVSLYGMERPIVVSLPDVDPDWKLNSEFQLPARMKYMGITEHRPAHVLKENYPRLHVFHGLSRCMVQLVLVEIPEDKTGVAWAKKGFLSPIAGARTKKTDAAYPGTTQSSSQETVTKTGTAGCEEPKKENKAACGEIKPDIQSSASGKKPNETEQKTQNKQISDNPKSKDESGVSWAKKGFLPLIAGKGTKKTNAEHPGTTQSSSEEAVTRTCTAGCEEPKKENKAARGEIKPDIQSSASGKKTNETEQKTQNKQIRDNPKNKEESGVSWARKGFLL